MPGLSGDAVLPDPLDHLAGENRCRRVICGFLDTLVAALPHPDPTLAGEVLTHLKTALPRHIRDEEGDLFPLLRRRSQTDADINDTLDRLIADHAHASAMLEPIQAALERLVLRGTAFTAEEATAITAFAARERRQLIVENGIVLPLARVRLSQSDLKSLRLRMLQRRHTDTDTAH
ncbi:hemerythrin domain-containing protein [Antarcticimicrobium sediminis]|uniref:hemerythrin domain-containing protein n=1 Tax=Antarcticimicrobium sediminis TaxID=2546227 RepID=UPI0014054154|nr:hemerythrin domain-containing protein [Antarcticimicrobium sediminis]